MTRTAALIIAVIIEDAEASKTISKTACAGQALTKSRELYSKHKPNLDQVFDFSAPQFPICRNRLYQLHRSVVGESDETIRRKHLSRLGQCSKVVNNINWLFLRKSLDLWSLPKLSSLHPSLHLPLSHSYPRE